MNILLLSQFFSTTKGGGEYVFSTIAKNLAKNDHKVFVITNKISNENYESINNVKMIFVSPVLEYKGGLPPGFMDNIRYSFNATKMGFNLIKKEKIDIIHSNNFAPALAGSLISIMTAKPHVTSIHDVFSLCGRNFWKMWGKQSNISRMNVFLAPLFEKLLMKLKYDCIHTVSKTTEEDLKAFGASKPIFVIHNTIEKIEKLDRKANPNQFIYVGRLVFYKNLDIVIRAIGIAQKDISQIRLVIVGDGPERKNLQELVKKLHLEHNIEFRGYVNSEEKMELIATSSAMVFPSLCEGFGLVILEAFSQQRPVLVSNIRPMSDIVTHGKNGYVLDPNDEHIWAKHLIKITKNPSEASIMGKNGSMLLAESYNQETMYQKVTSMYNEMLKNIRSS